MSEEEKMLAGELYDANYNKDLFDLRTKAKELCYDYNNLRPSDLNGKKELMRKILQKPIGDFIIEPNFYCDYGFNIEIGKNFYSNHNLVVLDANKVKFGDNVWIGGNVVTKDIPSNSIAVGSPSKVIRGL